MSRPDSDIYLSATQREALHKRGWDFNLRTLCWWHKPTGDMQGSLRWQQDLKAAFCGQ